MVLVQEGCKQTGHLRRSHSVAPPSACLSASFLLLLRAGLDTISRKLAVLGVASVHDIGAALPANGAGQRQAVGTPHDGGADPEEVHHVQLDRGTAGIRRAHPSRPAQPRPTLDPHPTVLGNSDGNPKKKPAAAAHVKNSAAYLVNQRNRGCGIKGLRGDLAEDPQYPHACAWGWWRHNGRSEHGTASAYDRVEAVSGKYLSCLA